jgi:hypothetical protein
MTPERFTRPFARISISRDSIDAIGFQNLCQFGRRDLW